MVTETTSQSDGNTSFLRAARAGHLDKVLDQLDKNNVDINTSNANGLNALHLASKDGHVHVVTELLKRGANVDSATKKGNTALHIASLAGQEDVVRLLVDNGASVNVQSQNGFTPLYMAAQENHDNVVKFLLASGANQSLATEDGFTPLAVAMQQGHDKIVAVLLENDSRGKVRLPALHIAAKKDDCKAAALLLQNEHNPDVTSKSGFTPLHIASHYGNEGIANLLLTKGADVNYSAKHNITPLHVAAKWGKSNMVSLLLEKGANIESKTRDGLTPLHCAARSGHEQVVDMLLERGAPISSKTKNGLAPLHMSSQGDHVDAARILLYHRAPVDEVTVDYLTALHVAAHCGHARVAKLLLDRKADPNARALNGFTPLHIACKKNRIKVVELLLKHGASIEATTESGLTPLHVASFMGCMNIVIYLLQNEANPDVPTVRGETPLHLAARANQTDIIRILLRNGAQVDARAREQQTPLHIAARLGNFDIVTLLLQHGAAVDSTTKDLYTALHIATKEGQDEVASVLIEHAASLTATTKKGFTPLHLAAKYGNIKVARLLLQRDAPVDAQGKNGVTPLHVASHYDHQNVALLLLEKGASPHATAKNGHTPLHIAAKKNQMDIATTLLEYGAKSNSESKAGFTPLHLSSQEGHTDMSSLLIDHSADTNKEAKNGLTPLHLCAQEDRVEVAAVLVENGAKVDSTTKAGYTPLHVASHFGQLNMVRFLVQQQSDVGATTAVGYTPLHQAAQQGHATIVSHLLDNGAPPNEKTNQGQTALSIAQKLGYISVVEALKGVTEPSTITAIGSEEKYKVVSPETMQETFMSDSEDEGGDVLSMEYGMFGQPAHAQHIYLPYYQGDSLLTREDTLLSEQPYRYLTVDEMKSLGDDSLPIDVTRDERFDSNRECMSVPPTAVDDTISPQHLKENYNQFITPDNVDIAKHPLHVGKLQWRNFLVSFLVDARGGAMRGCRHSGVRVIVPPRRAAMPMRVTCRYLKRDKLPHPPPLMEGEALASRILELGPVAAKFLGPVMIEVPHFGSLRGKEREIVILRSDNGETWREHTVEATDEAVQDVLSHSFEKEEMVQAQAEEGSSRTTRILTTDFPHYFAVVSRVRQEVHAIGPEGGMVSSSVVPQVQAVFPQGALTKKIKVGLQAQPIPAELAAKLLGNRVAVSPIVTVEPRRRKFHKPITLTIPVPQAANKGMINQYSGDAPTLRLLCSITGGTTRAQWEDVTGSTPLTFVNDCVSFTTTVSARFWLMDCRNISDATKMATELYREAIHVPFMAKFVVFAKRIDILEARLRVFCMTDDKEDKTLEHQEHFTEVAKSRDVEVLEGKPQYVEFAANLVPVTKSGDQLQLGFRAFRENRLPFTVRVKDPHAEPIGRTLFMREPKIPKGEAPQQPICVLNIVLPEEIIPETSLPDQDLHKYSFIKDSSGLESYQRADLRLSDISNLLGEDWMPLAEELGVSASDINRLKSECPGSVAQQGLAMLRFWVHQADNKASANTLEAALSHIGREDIVQQCIYNLDQTNFELLKDDRAPSREVTTKKSIALDRAYEDNIRKAEAEELRRVQERILQRAEGKEIEKDDKEESKYVAEEKEVEEEEEEVEEVKKSVSERRKEIEMRLSQEKEKIPKLEKRLSQETKVLTEKEIITSDSAKILDQPSEKEIAEEKKFEPDNEVPEPAELSFAEKRLSFEKGLKQDALKKADDKTVDSQNFIFEEQKVTVQSVAPAEVRKTVEQEISGKVKESETFESVEKRKTTETIAYSDDKNVVISNDQTVSSQRRDSQLMEGVTETFDRLGMTAYAPQPQDLLSPKVSKTPPPSPAEFKDTTAGTTAWEETATAQLTQAKSQTATDWANKSGKPDAAAIESSWSVSQEQEQRPTDTSEFSPKPPPRTTPKPEPCIDNSVKQPEISQQPDQEDAQDYSIKKKFWEQISSSGEAGEVKSAKHPEPTAPPPVPRPRSSIVSSVSLLKSEAESDTETTVTTLSDSTIRLKNVQQDALSKHSFTGSSDASDKEEVSETDAAESILPVSVPATVSSAVVESTEEQDKQPLISSSSDSESEHNLKSNDKPSPAKKSLSLDTEKKSKIPVVATRKTVYERSVSLPTSDLDASISSVRAKKRYFEAQIKKEMVVDQLMTQLEEESSPEHKSINQKENEKPTADPEAMVSRQIHSHIFSHEMDEQIESLVPESKHILEAEEAVVGKPVTVTEVAEVNNKVDARRTVKRTDSTLFEAEIVKLEPVMKEAKEESSITLDNVITNNVKNMKNIFEKFSEQPSLEKSITEPEEYSSAETKRIFDEQNICNDFIEEKTSTSLSSMPETLEFRSGDLPNQTSDSMEVHIDKSEIEESEKEKDTEESLKQEEHSNLVEDKIMLEEDEPIPSITVTLSGKQRTDSYSPADSEDNQSEADIVPEHSSTEEKAQKVLESQLKFAKTSSESREPCVHTPEEHFPDTVWEVPVQQEPETSEQEVTHDIPIESQIIVEKDEEDSLSTDIKQFQSILNKNKISISEEEAREIAEQVVEDIEAKIAEKNIIINDAKVDIDYSINKEVTEYFKQLSTEEVDEKLIESVIAKKQREQIMKASRKDTTTSSMEITDEDLRSSGVDTDISLIDSFPSKLKHLDEKSETDEASGSDNLKSNVEGALRDKEVLEKTLAEVKESLEAAQEELIEEHKKKQDKIDKKQSPSEFEFKVMSIDRLKDESIQESYNEDVLSTYDSEELGNKISAQSASKSDGDGGVGITSSKKGIEDEGQEFDLDHQDEAISTTTTTTISTVQENAVETEFHESRKVESQIDISSIHTTNKTIETSSSSKEEKYEVFDSYEEEQKSGLIHEDCREERSGEVLSELNYISTQRSEFTSKINTRENITDQIESSVTRENMEFEGEKLISGFKDSQILTESKEKTISHMSEDISVMKVQEQSNFVESSEFSAVHSTTEMSSATGEKETVASNTQSEHDEFVSKISKEDMKRAFSDESQKSSQDESIKSPVGVEEALSSSSSSGRKGDSDTMYTLGKPGVVMRKHKTGINSAERVSSRYERRSGTDYEPYSSSGESHYQSFEQTSESMRTPSRPCSSDIEGLMVGVAGTTGSSEYESAISHEASAQSGTSHEFHTAVSSLSSRESMKSLDSESSGNLASVEISSEASETLVPSAMELERDMEGVTGPVSEYYSPPSRRFTEPYEMDIPHHVIRGESPHNIRSMSDEKDSASFDNSADDLISEEDIELEKDKIDDGIPTKMKRSHEMIFQPDLRPASDSPVTEITDDKLASSLEEATSVISSMSSVSDNAVKTVLEISRTESDRMDGSVTSDQLSLTVSGTSEQLSLSSESHEEPILQKLNRIESSTSTQPTTYTDSVSSVTITTSMIKEQGIQSVCTQVTSQSETSKSASEDVIQTGQTVCHTNGPSAVQYKTEYDEIKEPRKKPGHRRNESTTFKPSMIPVLSKKSDSKSPKSVEGKLSGYTIEDTAESDKYGILSNLTTKEGRNDEKKDIDESEKLEEESYQTEADQGFHREMREARLTLDDSAFCAGDEHEETKESPASRPQSQVSKSDSEGGQRHMSSEISDDRPDSELIELMKQCSSDTNIDDPIERPRTPEPPEEPEIKDDTPEFSSEAQASITELELEYCGAFSRSIEYEAHVSPIHEKPYISFEAQDHQDDMAEAEAAFHMVPHISPTIPSVLPATIPEDPIAEKHELETREIALKEEMRRRSILAEATSPGSIPDITVTQHMAPLVDREFHYPDLELEAEEVAATGSKEESTPDTPASLSSKASTESEADQGREYIIDEPDGDDYIAEEPDTAELSMTTEDKTEIETKHETIIERDSATNSPGSDSFELLEKPDLADDFVIIEEVGKEAQEQDVEGKSVRIGPRRIIKKSIPDDEVKSPPAPATKMTDLKYYPPVKDDLGPFPFESESPPTGDDVQQSAESEEGSPPSDEVQTYENEVEAGKKWIEMQFQGEQAAAVYGYEFEHGPLEDIKEEEATDFESSSKIGSVGSQVSHSVGSFGSVKESLSSTPDYDVLAGRKYFTRSGEHDDVSMSSLQEFERIEHMIALESTKNKSLGSQDSLSGSGGSSRKHGTNRSGGDDISLSSLKEFEGLEMACIAAEKIESKAKEEEALLSEIEEGHESQASESESCETISAGGIKGGDSDSDDYEKRMFEIDEIIKQAQTNVERFTDLKDATEVSFLDKTESVGRGDSLEEVAKVPDLDLDQPLHSASSASKAYDSSSYTKHWVDENRQTKDSLERVEKLKIEPDQFTISTDSLDMKTGDKTSADAMSASTDSIEYQLQQKKSKGRSEIMTDSIELSNKSNIMSDSLDLDTVKHTDSIEDDDEACGIAAGVHDQSSSSGREGDLSSSGKEDSGENNRIPPPRAELMLGSTDSLEPTSSTATHATYHYETDSIMSSSFTSGGSNTMVSSTETLDAAARAEVWFEDGKPYVTEVIEPETDEDFSHIIHRTVELPPEIHKVTFQGADADKALREYVEKFGPGEDMSETQHVDEHGNVHIKRVVQRRVVIKPEQMSGAAAGLSGPELEQYIKHLSEEQMLGEMEPLEEQTGMTESDYSHLISSASSPPHSSESHQEYFSRHIVSRSSVSTPSTSITTTKKEISLIQQKGEKSPSGEVKAPAASSGGEPAGTREGDESPDDKLAPDNSSITDKLLASGATGANTTSSSK